MAAVSHRRLGLTSALALLVACAGTSNRPPIADNPPPPHVLTSLGYHDVVEVGTTAALQQGYSDAQLEEATPIGLNVWRIHFGLPSKGSGKLLHLEVDGASRRVIKFEEHDRLGIGLQFEPVRDGG